MKGIVFNLLESFICDNWGPAAYDDVLSRCTLSTREPFVGPGTYPDADLYAIAGAAAQVAGLPLPVALKSFGKYCFPHLAAMVPGLVNRHTSPESFLMSVDSVIHLEVRKLYPQAGTPSFSCEPLGDGRLRVRYRSERKLCVFMEGLLEGVAAHFQTTLMTEQTACMLSGHEHCEFVLSFNAAAEERL